MIPTKDISQWVKDMLTVAGFDTDNTEQKLYETLYHEYMAVKLFETLKDEDKMTINKTERLVKVLFESRFFLKEKKKKTKRTKENPPTPQIENKENIKEKKDKTHTNEEKKEADEIEKRKEAFYQECFSYVGIYGTDCVSDFYNWFSEPNRTNQKMRFECKRYWDTKKRLARWSKNHITADNTNAKLRLQKVKKTQEKEAASMEKQQMVAEIRMSDNERREKQQEESKKGHELTADYLARNPNGLLAKMAREKAKSKEKPSRTKTDNEE